MIRLALLLLLTTTLTFGQTYNLGTYLELQDTQQEWKIDSNKTSSSEGLSNTLFYNRQDSLTKLQIRTIFITSDQLKLEIPEYDGTALFLLNTQRERFIKKKKNPPKVSDIKNTTDFYYFESSIINDSLSIKEITALNIYHDNYYTFINITSIKPGIDLAAKFNQLIKALTFKKLSKSETAKKEAKSKEITLLRKIVNGEYDTKEYLNALLFNTYNKDFKKAISLTNSNDHYDIAQGLIENILRNRYSNQYRIKTYFSNFKFKEENKKNYYYEMCNLSDDKILVIWGELTGKNKYTYNTRVVDDLERFHADSVYFKHGLVMLQSREKFIVIHPQHENSPVISSSFKGDSIFTFHYRNCTYSEDSIVHTTSMFYTRHESVFPQFKQIAPNKSYENRTAANREDSYKYFQSTEYKAIKAYNDSIDAIKDSLWTEIIETVATDLRLYISDIKFHDLNNDGVLDFYWFAVSNGKLVHHEIYSAGPNNSLVKFESQALLKAIKETIYYKDYLSMSVKKSPPKI